MSKSLTELMGTSVASFFNNPEVRRRVSKIACQCNKQMGGGGSGTVTSVDITMPSAFSVSGNPITSSGTFAVTGAGTASQYIRGDGSLATFPSTSVPTLQQVLDAGNTADTDILLVGGTDQVIYVQGTSTSKVGAASVEGANPVAAQLNATATGTAFLSLNSSVRNFIDRSTAEGGELHFTLSNGATLTNTIFPDGRMSGTAATNNDEFVTLSQLDLKAPLNQPVFTGVPQAPTASAASNNTQIATTAFVTTAVANKTISLQQATTTGNTSSNELLITGNSLTNTNKGFHIAFDGTANKTSLTNIDVNANTNTTLITLDLHNIEFFTQTGFRLLGLNDQQSGGLASANFNGRVKGEGAFNGNEFTTKDQVMANGVTGSRPGGASIGQFYLDTTLNKPIWYNGTNWVDATGTTV